ncbi:MAG: SsrA-binding protein [Anaerolinea sp.]|nr:SsrA-binding protein [Anaerolinea sp.]
MEEKTVARNRKAVFEYFLLEHIEAGISLQGSEIKSIKNGQMSLAEAYVEIRGGDAWLMNSHIAPYNPANRYNHDPLRPRRLLLHKKEIRKLFAHVKLKGTTIIPVRVYIKVGRAKVEIALAKGKKLYDKRESIAQRDRDRETQRESNDRR